MGSSDRPSREPLTNRAAGDPQPWRILMRHSAGCVEETVYRLRLVLTTVQDRGRPSVP